MIHPNKCRLCKKRKKSAGCDICIVCLKWVVEAKRSYVENEIIYCFSDKERLDAIENGFCLTGNVEVVGNEHIMSWHCREAAKGISTIGSTLREALDKALKESQK